MNRVSGSLKIFTGFSLLFFSTLSFARESKGERESKALVLRGFLLTLDMSYLRCAQSCDMDLENKKIMEAWAKLKPLVSSKKPKLSTLFSGKGSLEIWRQSRRIVEEELELNLAPSSNLSQARGKALFSRHCASCHGPGGGSDGVLSSRLSPLPKGLNQKFYADFLAPAVVYNIILTGIPGTPMYPFKDQLSDLDMWALAFYTLSLSAGDELTANLAEASKLEDEVSMRDAARLNGLELKAMGWSDKKVRYIRTQEVFGTGGSK